MIGPNAVVRIVRTAQQRPRYFRGNHPIAATSAKQASYGFRRSNRRASDQHRGRRLALLIMYTGIL
jgi:hypothetical protein